MNIYCIYKIFGIQNSHKWDYFEIACSVNCYGGGRGILSIHKQTRGL